jgi:hypothetical protein
MNWLRPLVVAAAVLCVGQLPAAALEWHGSGEITVFNSACAPGGWTGTQFLFGIRYAPPSLALNGPSTRLTLSSGPFNHYNFVLPSGALNNTFQTVNVMHIGGFHQTYTAQMSVTSQTPATITATTDHVTLGGQINGFDGITNCVATFDIVLELVR